MNTDGALPKPGLVASTGDRNDNYVKGLSY